jgi:hypothetical protein
MRITTTPIALLALPALIHAHSVALIDFVPRVSDLSSNCNKIYQQAITGCGSSDFTKQGCSESCVKGLDAMTKPVKDACANEGLLDGDNKDSNVLAMFLQGRGPGSLCTNAAQVLQSGASSSSAAPTTSKEHSSSSTAEPTQYSTTSEASSTAIVSSTFTASSTDVPTSLVVDTSLSPEPTSSTSSTSSAESSDSTSSSTSSKSSQIFEAPSMPASWASTSAKSEPTASSEHSGGGSPFDAEGNQFSAATATSSSIVMLMLAITFTALAAQW